MICIVAVSDNHVIGTNQSIPWHIPGDMKWFKTQTYGGTLIMGRRTWESMGSKPLPGRKHIILSRTDRFDEGHPSVYWTTSVDECVRIANDLGRQPYVIGGSDIYRLFFLNKYIDTLLLTRVYTHIPVVKDTTYMVLPRRKTKVWQSRKMTYNDIDYQYFMYKIKYI